MNDSMNVAGNAINTPDSAAPRTRSKFNTMSYHMYNTERFGEYNVPFVMECVEGDRVPLRSGGDVQSYTLKAPLMQSISKKKDFYMVPMEAILPRNWDKFYTNPVVGDDVPDDVGCGVEHFWQNVVAWAQRILSILKTYTGNGSGISSTAAQRLTYMFRGLILLEYFFSNGSLIASLGCKGSRYLHIYNHSLKGRAYSYDRFFDVVCAAFANVVPWFEFTDSDGFVKRVVNDEANYGHFLSQYSCISMHDFLQYMRDDPNGKITAVDSSVDANFIYTYFYQYFNSGASNVWEWQFNSVDVPYNLSRLWAYQIVCAHFYSNDHVDYIYSAELLRQLVTWCVCRYANNTMYIEHFTMNGMRYLYDAMSAHNFTYIITNTNAQALLTDDSSDQWKGFRAYFGILLSYRRSLRFVDYFTGSRTRPLAVGSVSVNVNNNTVDVIDVSRNIQKQRFLNAVNRFGRKFEEYIKGLSGHTPAQDYHNPLYLAHTSDLVYGTRVENTGANQLTDAQTVTSRLMSNGSRYQFEFSVDRPCVVIGISYYDINRAYLYSCERQLMHLNRFDMFNPFMQFIGDQPVYFAELGENRSLQYNGTFGYQLRHMEYKQRFSQASGAFVENLPGYVFDNEEDDSRSNSGVQSVDFIRSLNSEIDKFYVSLTGYSLGSYFHFIVDNDNNCEPSRPMAFAPTIL